MTAEAAKCVICEEMKEMFKRQNRQIIDKCPECGTLLQYVKPSLQELLTPALSKTTGEITDKYGHKYIGTRLMCSDMLITREFIEINKILLKMRPKTVWFVLESNDKYDAFCLFANRIYTYGDKSAIEKIHEPFFISLAISEYNYYIDGIFSQSDVENHLPFFIGKNYITDDILFIPDSNTIDSPYKYMYSLDHLIKKYKFNLAIWANEKSLNSTSPAGM